MPCLLVRMVNWLVEFWCTRSRDSAPPIKSPKFSRNIVFIHKRQKKLKVALPHLFLKKVSEKQIIIFLVYVVVPPLQVVVPPLQALVPTFTGGGTSFTGGGTSFTGGSTSFTGGGTSFTGGGTSFTGGGTTKWAAVPRV